MIRVKLFDGIEKDITAYNGQALINYAIDFYTEECDDDINEDIVAFLFPGFVSGYFRIYNERLGFMIRDIVTTVSESFMFLNTNDMTFDDNGNYYYEIGYIQTGGYETVLMFGTLNVK